jgi:hypothetical protein
MLVRHQPQFRLLPSPTPLRPPIRLKAQVLRPLTAMRFLITTDRPGPLAIHELLQHYADQQWVPAHLSDDQKAAYILHHFREQIEAELAKVKIERKPA